MPASNAMEGQLNGSNSGGWWTPGFSTVTLETGNSILDKNRWKTTLYQST
jgi:hypothetical protein